MRSEPEKPLRHRLAWFVGLWATGVIAVLAVSYLLRLAVIG